MKKILTAAKFNWLRSLGVDTTIFKPAQTKILWLKNTVLWPEHAVTHTLLLKMRLGEKMEVLGVLERLEVTYLQEKPLNVWHYYAKSDMWERVKGFECGWTTGEAAEADPCFRIHREETLTVLIQIADIEIKPCRHTAQVATGTNSVRKSVKTGEVKRKTVAIFVHLIQFSRSVSRQPAGSSKPALTQTARLLPLMSLIFTF